MPIMEGTIREFIERRLSEFLGEIQRQGLSGGSSTSGSGTSSVTTVAKVDKKDKVIVQLQEENQELKKTVDTLLQRLLAVEESIKHLGTGVVGIQYDLKLEFDITAKSQLQLDFVSKPITGEILNELFESVLRKDNAKGFSDYEFPVRAINTELTLEEWIIPGVTKKTYSETNKRVIDITKFWVNESGSMKVDNSFVPWDLNQIGKRISLGTGTGKSTHFLRCVAFRGRSVQELEADKSIPRGATLVVPFESLIASVLGSHNYWLSTGQDLMKEKGELVPDPKKRVTQCIICRKNHSAQFDEQGEPIMYSVTKKNEEGDEIDIEKHLGKYNAVAFEPGKPTPSSMINVFTYWDFLDAYDNNLKDEDGNPLIKDPVIFDEAHTIIPAYANTIEKLQAKKKKNFRVVEMSATFGSHPTSKKLAGHGEDFYVTDFTKLLKERPKIFTNRSTIIFCDNTSKLNKSPKDPFKILRKHGIKYEELGDALKECATELVEKIMKAPGLFFANNDYSVGFSFGNVNVIPTGVSEQEVIADINKQGELVKTIVSADSPFDRFMQERGRKDREETHDGTCMSLIPKSGDYKGKLVYKGSDGQKRDDLGGEIVDKYFQTDTPSKEAKDNLQRLIKALRKPKVMKDLDPEIGRGSINRLLVYNLQSNLNSKLDPINLFHIQPSEKGKRKPGEYVFRNKLVKYLKEEDIKDLMIMANEAKVKTLVQAGFKAGKYPWHGTPEPEDDFVFPDELGIKTFGPLFQFRLKDKGFAMEVLTNKEKEGIALKFTFKPYVLNQAKKDFLSGKTQTYIEVPPKN